jgi:hypothetical protein
MTTEEAKKAGFRPTRTALMNCWHLTKAGSIENVGVEFDNLSADDFPTREKAREALRRRKGEVAIEHAVECVAKTYALSQDKVNAIMLAFTQIAGKGRVQSEELVRQLGQYIPALQLGEAEVAAHKLWLEVNQSQLAPITQEQAKLLRDGDSFYLLNSISLDGISKVTWVHIDETQKVEAIGGYFTRAAAQAALDKCKLARYEKLYSYIDDSEYAACVEARDWDGADLRVDALDKAKAEAEPLEWCEYNEGYRLSPEAFISFDDGKTWTTVTGKFIGVCYSERLGIRARYRNPLWLAKHGHKGMVFNNNTNRWEPDTSALDELVEQAQELRMGYETDKPCDVPEALTISGKTYRRLKDGEPHDSSKGDLPAMSGSQPHRFGIVWYRPVESHETPVGETQGKEVVTDETQPTILEEAAKCVTGPRRRDYETPEENFSLIAKLWSLQLKHEVTPMQVALCLILLKVARQANSPKRDNLVDIAGYAQCASELKGAK